MHQLRLVCAAVALCLHICCAAERYAQIEHENRILLSKMSDIVAGKSSVDCRAESAEYAHSLNREARRRELQRITEENLVRVLLI